MMELSNWKTAQEVWRGFCGRHPALGQNPKPFGFYNLLRVAKGELLDLDILRKVRGHQWIANEARFDLAVFEILTRGGNK
jgi:hypothetical protein